jgi:hypothetical protein
MPHKVMCGVTWGQCGQPVKGNVYSHVCGVWIYPGESHTHVCGTCHSS